MKWFRTGLNAIVVSVALLGIIALAANGYRLLKKYTFGKAEGSTREANILITSP